MAADNGDAEAQMDLGNCFEKGVGVAKDMQEAVRHYRMVAEGDVDAGVPFSLITEAQLLLGIRLTKTGVVKDECEGFRYLRMAADQGDSVAAGWRLFGPRHWRD
jgi:uncharacterized protein